MTVQTITSSNIPHKKKSKKWIVLDNVHFVRIFLAMLLSAIMVWHIFWISGSETWIYGKYSGKWYKCHPSYKNTYLLEPLFLKPFYLYFQLNPYQGPPLFKDHLSYKTTFSESFPFMLSSKWTPYQGPPLLWHFFVKLWPHIVQCKLKPDQGPPLFHDYLS